MREPRCNHIVQSKNLWEIAIEFIQKIDDKLMDFNLKQAYITYKICKYRNIPYETVSKLVFLSCFNNVGKYYAAENKSDPEIETYLFLKYFSPVKNYADALLCDLENHKLSIPHQEAILFKTCYDYTKLVLDLNNTDEALKALLENKDEYDHKVIKALEKLIKKTDLLYEFNSVHYKTIIYRYISRTIFSAKEKNKFISMLSSLFEMYSAQTLYHSKLTAIIAYILAHKQGIKFFRAKRIYMAGLCHDLGKVCIPLKILEKPDKLTDREYSQMKKHVTFTKDILNSKMDYEIIEMCYRHHEKLDGSGYPNKLKGDYITKDQRILQVADIISALVAKRSYKEAWDTQKTISILEQMANDNKIDKNVVQCFKNNQKKILKAAFHFTEQADKLYEKINREREILNIKKNPNLAEVKLDKKKAIVIEKKVEDLVEKKDETLINEESPILAENKDEAQIGEQASILPGEKNETPVEVQPSIQVDEQNPTQVEEKIETQAEEQASTLPEERVEIKAEEESPIQFQEKVEAQVNEQAPIQPEEKVETQPKKTTVQTVKKVEIEPIKKAPAQVKKTPAKPVTKVSAPAKKKTIVQPKKEDKE